MRKLNLLIFIIFFLQIANAQEPIQFELGREHFMVNGKSFKILSGEMHYARIPKPYWRQRIKMAKAMGLNTISTYVFWNYHELSPGVFDFKSENRNLAEFITIAQEEGMFVILRPGPYVCAEWDLGGLPWWLLNIPGMELRSLNPDYQSKVLAYFKALHKEVHYLQWQYGGPIILTQVENEYGSFAAQIGATARVDSLHQNLMGNTADQLRAAGFEGPFFTADGNSLTQYGAIPGILPCVNGEGNPQAAMDTIKKYNYGKGPFFVAELYPGWLTHWSEKEAHVSTESVVNETKILLDGGVDINFYMFHGGTNFGWMSGANYNHEMAIQPDITSYDYDAPLTESGDPSPKYLAIRELLKSYQNDNQAIAEIPIIPKAIRIPLIQLSPPVALLNNLPQGIPSEHPRTMESLGQGYGWILYRSNLKRAGKGWLKVKGLRDY
ncbi:MAG: beta-galactosidase, partial [Saprospiraceae bacterium]